MADFLPLFQIVDRIWLYILALTLATVRMAGLLQTFPLFTTIGLRGQIRAVIAIALAVPIVPLIHDELLKEELAVYGLLIIAAKEFLIGILIGTLVSLPFWGVQAAGDLIDSDRGASAANLADPVNANENSLTGTILLYASLAVFVMMGGLKVVFGIVYDSYSVLPVLQMLPEPGPELPVDVGRMVAKMFIIGVVVSGPIMICLIVIDISLVFATRMAQQIPANDFANLIKNLCVAAFLPLYSMFLSQYLVSDWASMMGFLRGFLGLDISGGR